jgi:hypothetical protein
VGIVESATFKLKVEAPEAVGVPEMVPVEEFKLSPAGNLPTLIDHVYGIAPPLAVTVVL